MTIRVLINGAFGKMGALACATLEAHPDFKLLAKLGRNDDLAKAIQEHQAQVVVDLTLADVVYTNTLKIIEQHAHPVIGTSGLNDQQVLELQSLCEREQLGGIIVPNFSIGAVLMMHFSSIAARLMSDVEIVEMHHPQKLDAPSGTAMKTAELISAAREGRIPNLAREKMILDGARGARYQDVMIHSLRLSGVLAKQDVIFGHPGETLTLSHQTIDRQAYMPGLVLACQRAPELPSLYNGLEKLLDLSQHPIN